MELEDRKAPLNYSSANGIIEWNVPYSEAYLQDFLDTHGIEEYDGVYLDSGFPLACGIGLPDVIEIWEIVTPYILNILSCTAPKIDEAQKLLDSINELRLSELTDK